MEFLLLCSFFPPILSGLGFFFLATVPVLEGSHEFTEQKGLLPQPGIHQRFHSSVHLQACKNSPLISLKLLLLKMQRCVEGATSPGFSLGAGSTGGTALG